MSAPPSDNEKKAKKGMVLALALASELLALELVGIFAGHYLGEKFGNGALGAVAGSALGFAVWTWRLIATKRFMQ